jgi:tetratricopeptide (TPR) repeat protein
VRRSFSSSVSSYCPRCFEKGRYDTDLVILCALVASFLLAAAIALIAKDPLAKAPAPFLAFFVFIYAAIWPHEAGHALCAWALGLRVYRICIGRGPTLLTVRLGDFRLEIHALMDRGFTQIGHPSRRFLRLRSFLMTLAGLLANLFLAVTAWYWLPSGAAFRADSRLNVPFFFGIAFIGANLLLLVMSLVPYKTRWPVAGQASDGLKLLLIPFMSRAAVEQAHALYFFQEAQVCLDSKDYVQAIQWCERGLAAYPHDCTIAYARGCALLTLKHYGKAWEQFSSLFARKDLLPAMRALVGDAIATALLYGAISEDPGVLESAGLPLVQHPDISLETRKWAAIEEAAIYSKESLSRCQDLPWQAQASIQATAGCILVEQGKPAEALPILQSVMSGLESAHAQAVCACYIALAAARLGMCEKSERWLKTARELDTECVALQRVSRELAGSG